MKTKFLIAFLIGVAAHTKAQWVTITPNQQDDYGVIDFVNDNVGWVASHSSNYLHKTTDGGGSWTKITIDSLALITDVQFINQNVGYIIGENQFFNNKLNVMKTEDGGNTWSSANLNVSGKLTAIFFKNEATGFITANDANVYRTNDGGDTWNIVHALSNEMLEKSMHNINSDTLYFAGWDWTFAYKGAIAKSTDGGNTWNESHPFGINSYISGMSMLNGNTGFASVTFNQSPMRDYIYKTNDGFATYDSILKPTPYIYDLLFITETNGYLLSDSGIYITTDGSSFSKDHNFIVNYDDLYQARFEKSDNNLFVTNGMDVYKKQIETGFMEHEGEEGLLFFPNPATEKITLQGEYTGVIELYNVSMKKAGNWNKAKSSLIIDVANKPTGVYFLKSGSSVQKLVID